MILLKNVSAGYSNENDYKAVIKNIEIKTHEGKITGIIGSSGSGKTTLAKVLTGTADLISGDIIYNEKNIILSRNAFLTFRKNIAYVPQNSFNSLDLFTDIGTQFRKLMKSLNHDFDQNKIHGLIEKFMLPENVLKMKPGQLSDGMKHRIIIIMALAAEKPVMIFDEPTTGMDSISSYNVLSAIKEASKGRDVIITGNDVESIFSIAEHIYVLYNGIIIEDGEYNDILMSQFHPYTSLIMEYIPEYKNRNKKLEMPENRNEYHHGCVFLKQCKYSCVDCLKDIEYNYIKNHGYRCIRYPGWKNDNT